MYAAWGVLGIVLGAAYLLWLFQRTMFGPVTHAENEKLPDLNAREFATLVPLVVMAFWIGVYPKPFFNYLEQPVRQIVERVKPGYYYERPSAAKVPQVTLPAPAATPKQDAAKPQQAGGGK